MEICYLVVGTCEEAVKIDMNKIFPRSKTSKSAGSPMFQSLILLLVVPCLSISCPNMVRQRAIAQSSLNGFGRKKDFVTERVQLIVN